MLHLIFLPWSSHVKTSQGDRYAGVAQWVQNFLYVQLCQVEIKAEDGGRSWERDEVWERDEDLERDKVWERERCGKGMRIWKGTRFERGTKFGKGTEV